MSIKNLLRYASAALLPILTRTNSMVPLTMITGAAVLMQVGEVGDAPILLNICRIIRDLTIGKISLASPILGLGANLLTDAGMFVATAIGSIRSLKAGITGDDQALASSAQRTVLSGIGIAGLASVAHGLQNLVPDHKSF